MVAVSPIDVWVIPGRVYRDLDGSLVHLLTREHDLCTWAPLDEQAVGVHTTHVDNFRRRFRPIEGAAITNLRRSA